MKSWKTVTSIFVAVIGGSVSVVALKQLSSSSTRRNERKINFEYFASVEYKQQAYLTPKDFLDTFLDHRQKPRKKRKILNDQDVNRLKKLTPQLSESCCTFFRDRGVYGIISFPEYLFLLSILTKKQDGFRIAFNMFDREGNQRISKEEFLVLQRVQKTRPSGNKEIRNETEGTGVDTTLLVHFFGPEGSRELSYEEFERFMKNLQREILEIEFLEFSQGSMTISQVDFANILLRYTRLTEGEYEDCISRVSTLKTPQKDVTFEDFEAFFTFLNYLEYFESAMRVFAPMNRSFSKEEFYKIVKICSGKELGGHVIDVVFGMFGDDQDGTLRHKTFFSIMQDRYHHGSYLNHRQTGFRAFKRCIRHEMCQ